ncbi:MAG TPA: hypothetical protein PKH17_04085 [Candidatus Syntrophosphaera sp.]|nr:hypothetical protein [Candidatus Syntrophosphaera sp.]
MFFCISWSLLFSQDISEEYNLLKNYVLPDNATPFNELTLQDSLYLKDGIPFTGIAYDRYENGKLARVVTFYKGIQNGPMYIWYPNGAPQLSTNYRQGKFHGWYIGWYSNGTIFYNMAFNQGKYVGDYQDDNDRRQEQELPEYEGDADSLNERD